MRPLPQGAGWSAPTKPRAPSGFRRSDIPPCCGSCRRARPSCRPRARRRRRCCCRRRRRRVGCQPIAWPRSAPACLTRPNRASASGVIGLGGRAKPPCSSICDVALGGDRCDRLVDQSARAPGFELRRRRAQVDAQDREVGNDIGRRSAVDPRRVDRQPGPCASLRTAARGRRRRGSRCGRPPDCGRRGPSGRGW